jgi:hypothetical protein
MSSAKTLVLRTTGLNPIQPSGFVPPSQRVGYSDPLVQDLLRKAFRGQFPRLDYVGEDSAVYRHENPATDSFTSATVANSIDDLPQPEVMRLLQGWIALRKIAMEPAVPEGVRALLMNLKIPDPRVAPHFYRVQGIADDRKKLYVLIGFEGPAVPSIALEEGIAAMMNVPPSQLESLLAVSMTPSVDTSTAAEKSPAENETELETPGGTKRRRGGKGLALAGVAVLLVASLGVAWSMGGKPAEGSMTVEHHPEVSGTPSHATVMDAGGAAPESSKTHTFSPLEEMSTGVKSKATPGGETTPKISDTNLSDLMAQ